MVYQPAKFPAGDWAPTGLDFEDAWFEASDGTQLHGWFLPHPRPRAVALFCHGNAGNLSTRSATLRQLHDRHGLTVLVFDYRGYGRSEGTPNEDGVIADARAARDWLCRKTRRKPQDILLLGRSLGGGVAVQLASTDGARGLVLASTFTSLPDVGAEHVPLLAPRLVMRNRFPSLKHIASYQGPLLISHGDADKVIPFEHGQKLFEEANQPKQFVRIPGGRHNDGQTEEYRQAFDDFIDALPPEHSTRIGLSRPAAEPNGANTL